MEPQQPWGSMLARVRETLVSRRCWMMSYPVNNILVYALDLPRRSNFPCSTFPMCILTLVVRIESTQ